MTKLIATDLDGTFFYPKRKIGMIPRRSLKFVRQFIADGGKILLVTGRSHFFTIHVEEKVGANLDVIGMNGAYMLIDGEVYEEHFLSSIVTSLVDDVNDKFKVKGMMLLSKRYPLLIDGPDMTMFRKYFYRFYYWSQGVYAEDYLVSHSLFQNELRGNNVYKIMFYFGLTKKGNDRASEVNKYIRAHYGDSLEASWTGGFIEITPKGTNKANGIKKYLKLKGINEDEVVVVGDSGNDISMFNAFYERSFCMGHASKKVKKYAKHIIRRFHDLQAYL